MNGNVEALNTLVNNLYDVQKVRIGMANRNLALRGKSREEIFEEHVARLKELEKDIVDEMKREITQFPISEWLLRQRGIGISLTGQTIAIVRDISRFNNISKLWAYSGMATMHICKTCGKRWLESPKREEWIIRIANRLEEQHNKKRIRHKDEVEVIGDYDTDEYDVYNEEGTNFIAKARRMLCDCKNPNIIVIAQRRIKRTMADYNPKMKKLCRNIALSLIQYNQFYGDIYNSSLQTYLARDDLTKHLNEGKYKDNVLEKIKQSRAIKMARRKMIKIFLSHLWVQWRKIEGLPVTRPYIFDIKKHTDYIEPPERIELEHVLPDNDSDSNDSYF